MPEVETSTPANTPTPIGPYSHIAKLGSFITIGGTAGVNPTTGELAGPEIEAQTRQILDSFQVMLESFPVPTTRIQSYAVSDLAGCAAVSPCARSTPTIATTR